MGVVKLPATVLTSLAIISMQVLIILNTNVIHKQSICVYSAACRWVADCVAVSRDLMVTGHADALEMR